MSQEITDLRQIRIEKLRRLQEKGTDPFRIEKFDRTHQSQDIVEQFDELNGQTVSIAGRVMTKRMMGKASFIHIQDM
ncbi:MAG: lysine--tRNA ligase, partial [Tissierellia bacterium]|nr:lysine--tRNA ligase [Tissierellia bacterium]